MKAVLGNKMKNSSKGIMIVLLIFAVAAVTSIAFAKDPVTKVKSGILDPFSLTVYQPKASSQQKDEQTVLPGSMEYDILMGHEPLVARSTEPIQTYHQWIRIPYRPPVRSPFKPW